jgi:hypothetical protein
MNGETILKWNCADGITFGFISRQSPHSASYAASLSLRLCRGASWLKHAVPLLRDSLRHARRWRTSRDVTDRVYSLPCGRFTFCAVKTACALTRYDVSFKWKFIWQVNVYNHRSIGCNEQMNFHLRVLLCHHWVRLRGTCTLDYIRPLQSFWCVLWNWMHPFVSVATHTKLITFWTTSDAISRLANYPLRADGAQYVRFSIKWVRTREVKPLDRGGNYIYHLI